MDVDMGAFRNVLDGFSHRPAVFKDRLIFGQFAHRHLMSQRNILEQLHAPRGFAFQSYRAGRASLLQIRDGDADIVARFM